MRSKPDFVQTLNKGSWEHIQQITTVTTTFEYERQGPAPRRGLAPPVLIFQTSPSCNIFTKIPNFLRNRCQPSHKGLVFGRYWV